MSPNIEKISIARPSGRRDFLKTAVCSGAGALLAPSGCGGRDPLGGMQTGLHQFTIKTAPFEEGVRAADAAGFQWIDLIYPSLHPYLQNHSEDAVVELFAGMSVKPGALVAYPRFLEMDSGGFQTQLPEYRRYLGLCRKLGIKDFCVVCIAGPDGDDRSFYQCAVDRMRDAADVAGEYDVTVMMEPLGATRYFNSTKRVLDFLADVRKPNLGWVLDAFHLYRGGDTLEDALPYMDERLRTVQFHDVGAGTDMTTAKDDARVMPGDGILPLADMARALAAHGYKKYLSVELFHPGYWAMPADAVAREAHDKLVRTVTEALA